MRDIEPGERERLESLAVEPDAVARRAKIVLALGSSGLPLAAVARLFGVSAATVRHWRDRFAANGADGLADRPRSGAPRVIGKKARASIASLVGKGMSSREIAQRLGISQSSVSRIARDGGGRRRTQSPATGFADDGRAGALAIALFESLADPTPWTRFFDRMRNETQSDFCILLISTGTGARPPVILSGGAPLEGVASYVERFFAEEPMTGMAEGQVVTLSEIVSPEALRASDFYRNYLARYGVGHVLGIDIGSVRGITGRLRLSRLETRQNFGARERAVCQRLVPYLRAALSLFVQRTDTEAEKEALSATVSGMSVGSILVDPEAHIVDANPTARAILDEYDGVFLAAGRLALSRPAQSNLLRELILRNAEASLHHGVPHEARAILVSRPSGREGLSLLVRPAAAAADGTPLIRHMALVQLVDPAQPRVRMIDALMQLFGLTPTEAKVALSIANGASIAETAQRGGTSRNTVRSQLRSVFSKMGITRQAELTRAVLTSVALLSLQEAA